MKEFAHLLLYQLTPFENAAKNKTAESFPLKVCSLTDKLKGMRHIRAPILIKTPKLRVFSLPRISSIIFSN